MRPDVQPATAAVESTLQEQLDAAFPSSAGHRIVIAIRQEGLDTLAVTGDRSGPAALMETGCLTKLLTGALLRRHALARGISLDAPATHIADHGSRASSVVLE